MEQINLEAASSYFKAFDTVCHNILTDKLIKYKLDKWAVRWTENWLNCQAQRVVISSTKSSWRLVTSSVPRGQYWGQYCLTPSLMTWMMGRSTPSAGLWMIKNSEEWFIH